MTNPRLYRRRPQTVEARQVNADDWDSVQDIANWCGGDAVDLDGFVSGNDSAVLFVPDRDGEELVGSYAEHGDWVVRDAAGHYDVYPDGVFDAHFEPVVKL